MVRGIAQQLSYVTIKAQVVASLMARKAGTGSVQFRGGGSGFGGSGGGARSSAGGGLDPMDVGALAKGAGRGAGGGGGGGGGGGA